MVSAVCNGRVEILTFKQGFLSAIAHDLRLSCPRHEVKVDGRTVAARFWPDSLIVKGAVRGSVIDPDALSADQKAEILSNIREKILCTRQHPEISFSGAAEDAPGGYHVTGKLELVGRQVELSFFVRRSEGRLLGDVELEPTRWGIQPFRALLGAIRLQDRVVVRFDLEAPANLT